MLNFKERAKGRKTKSKIKPDKTVKVKNQTSDIMSKTLKKETKEDKLRKFQKIKQKTSKQNPFTSSANPSDIPIKSKIKKSIVDVKSPRTGRATRTTKPVTGNIGEIKTSTKKPIIDTQKRTGKVKGNIGQFKTEGKSKIAEVDSSKREKFKTKPVPGNRPGVVKTSGPSIVDKSKRGKPTSRLDKIKTRAKMVMDNIARSADNLYPSKQAKDIVIRKSVGGRLDDLGYEEVDKRPVSKNKRSYRGYGAARKN
jgi:hypothetical protein